MTTVNKMTKVQSSSSAQRTARIEETAENAEVSSKNSESIPKKARGTPKPQGARGAFDDSDDEDLYRSDEVIDLDKVSARASNKP